MPRRAASYPLALTVVAVCGAAAPAAVAAPFACSDFLRMHGLLRRAAAICGYSAYNPAIVERARSCFEAVGSREGARQMYAGASEYDRMAAVRNRDALCLSLASKFPMVVRP
ncbi:hypothetical protein FVE89_11805 [Methylobacterium sp. 2A]|nr:hypothetical protein [Methylobacterium organophilum]MWV22667.1 hypothetical protein [Methylobacterium sp. 2A]